VSIVEAKDRRKNAPRYIQRPALPFTVGSFSLDAARPLLHPYQPRPLGLRSDHGPFLPHRMRAWKPTVELAPIGAIYCLLRGHRKLALKSGAGGLRWSCQNSWTNAVLLVYSVFRLLWWLDIDAHAFPCSRHRCVHVFTRNGFEHICCITCVSLLMVRLSYITYFALHVCMYGVPRWPAFP
jgi:hypothetical protein